MGSISAGDLTHLRTNHPHKKVTQLTAIPHVKLLQARVNDAGIALGEESIVYDSGTGTAAEYALVEVGQTLLIGTAAGLDNLGRARVKSITGSQTSGTITVAWNSDVDWTNNAFLTILHFYEMWPLFPRFTVSPEVFYKDKTLTYASQTNPNVLIPPVAIIGPPWAGELVSGSVTIDLNATGSYAMASGATISSHLWSVATAVVGAGPSIASPTASSTTITLDAPGLYWIKYTVTDSNGKTQIRRQPLYAHDSTDPPIAIESASRSMDYDQGGGSLSFTLRDSADETKIPDKTMVILWSNNTYATTSANVSFLNSVEYSERDHIDFVGYIIKGNMFLRSDETGDVEFEAVTVQSLLDQKFEYPVVLIADDSLTGGTIDAWWKFTNNQLTVARAMHHLWKWHSTLFDIADVHLPTSDTRIRAGTQDFTEGSLLDRARTFASEHGIFANPVCNKYGSLYVELDSQMLTVSQRAALTDTITLAVTDWRDEISAILNQHRKVADAKISGGYWNGTVFAAFCSKWGEIAANDGTDVASASKIMVVDQAGVNHVSGRLAAIPNRPILELGYSMAGNYSSVFDVAPQQWVRLSLTGSEPGNKKGLVISNIRSRVVHEETSFNAAPGINSTDITLQPEALGRDGITTTCPGLPAVPEPPAPPWDTSGASVVSGCGASGLTAQAIAQHENNATSHNIVVKLTATKSLAMWQDTVSNVAEAAVLDISGDTITPGTPATFEASGIQAATAVALSTTDVLVLYANKSNGDIYAIVLQVSGSTVTPGTTQLIETGSSSRLALANVSSTRALAFYNTVSPHKGVVLDISGTTITVNSISTILSGDAGSGSTLEALPISSTAVLLIYNSTAAVLKGRIYSSITTTFTENAATTLRTKTNLSFGNGSAGMHVGSAIALVDGSTYVVTYKDNDTSPDETNVFAGTWTGTTVDAPGSDVQLVANNNGSIGYVTEVGDDQTIVLTYWENAASKAGQGNCATVAGTVITLGSGGFVAVTPTSTTNNGIMHLAPVDNDRVMLAFQDESDGDGGKSRLLDLG